MKDIIEKLEFGLYHFIECIDGEKRIKIMSYRRAEKIKIWVLRGIYRQEHRRLK